MLESVRQQKASDKKIPTTAHSRNICIRLIWTAC